MNKIPIVPRSCPICSSVNSETLWEYEYLTKTCNQSWLFNVHNVICTTCGFVFTSPVADENVLMSYYADSFTRFVTQDLDYNVDKRICIVQKYVDKREVFVEFGANVKTEFHNRLEKLFSSVLTAEPNESASSDFKKISDISNIQADCVAHYFVLEHVPDISTFLQQIRLLLKPEGIMICEVPLLSLYEKYISPLILHEHVNHFSINSLIAIAAQNGFELIDSSVEECSRPFGFVSVFRKVEYSEELIPDEYAQNKKLFLKGLHQKDLFLKVIEEARSLIRECEDDIILIYAANETTKKLINNLNIPKNVYVVDSNPLKRDYFAPMLRVYLPEEVKDEILVAKHLIICTQNHAKSIIKNLETNYKKTFQTN